LAKAKWNAADIQRLYRRHGAVLVAYARSFLPDAATAEDVVHSVFLRLLRGDVAAPESELGYLYRAAKNAAALQMPPAKARERLHVLHAKQNAINLLIGNFIPNFEKVNTNREEVLAARKAAINALAAK